MRAIRFCAIQVLIICTILVVVETLVRVFRPDITELGTSRHLFADSVYADSPAPAPGMSGSSNGATFEVVKFEGLGFWRYSAGLVPARPSWLFLGDSVTMGIGVQPDSTFAGRMARSLPEVNVLNPSVIGYSLEDYHNVVSTLLASKGEMIDKVVVFWCPNDLYYGEAVRPDGRSWLEWPMKSLRRHSRTYQVLKSVLVDRSRFYYEHDASLYNADAVLRAHATLKDMKRIADSAGVDLSVVLLPYEFQLRNQNVETVRNPQEIMAEVFTELGIPHLDLREPLQTRSGESSSLFLFGDGIHFSTLGHRIIAEALNEKRRLGGWP